MAQYGYGQQNPQNLQFYQSSYGQQSQTPVSGHSTPFSSSYPATNSYSTQGFAQGFAGAASMGSMGVSQSGLRTGWLAAFGYVGSASRNAGQEADDGEAHQATRENRRSWKSSGSTLHTLK